MKRFLVVLGLLLASTLPVFAQYPWTGGLNACQFGRMDLDGDGISDLIAFDRHGDRILCFLNKGGAGVIDYLYTDAYDAFFPELHGWVIFSDYDGDGKEDIFTYSKGWAGIKVYRNVSINHPEFQLVVDPYLSSWQGGGEVNILATEADYPAIVDVDGDGDLDLLTFGVMGTFIEKHRNLSVERFGCRDSLLFERTDPCWGHVAESEENNLMYLDTCLFGYGIVVTDECLRHRGSTVTIRDLTGDGLLDMLLADVDYPGLTLLINGGASSSPMMVSQETDFPPRKPVSLFSMPLPFFTDIDNDGVDDLLVSPFDPDPMVSEGQNSVWLYLNRGTDNNPDFQLVTKSFLQDSMLDVGTGAYPVIVDYDGDGLLDLVVGTVGNVDSVWYQYGSLEVRRQPQLTLLKNVGTAQVPAYSVKPFPMAFPELDGMAGWVPAFADLDGDGRLEMLLGTAEGRMALYDDDGTLLDLDLLHYDKAWSAPCFYDVDQDGNMDLVVGNASGRLSLYLGKDGSFEKKTDYWGGVDVRDYATSYYGYSVPALFRLGGKTYLCVGSESGRIFLFDGVSAEDEAVFEDVSDRWTGFCETMPRRFGMRSAASLADLDNDGRLDIIVGNFSGGLQLYNAVVPVNFSLEEIEFEEDLSIYPNPVQSQLRIVSKNDRLRQVIVVDLMGRKRMERAVERKDITLELSVLPSGVYLLVAYTERGLVNRIFLKR